MDKKKQGTTATASAPPGSDDFKLIKGIGPSIEQRLHHADILTFVQLAALSPEDIAEVLGNSPHQSAEHIKKQNWIGQARELASRPVAEPSRELTIPNGRQRLATFTVELLLATDGHVRRTRIVHHPDEHEDKWSYWEAKRLTDFIVEHAGIPRASHEPEHVSEPGTMPGPLSIASATETPLSEPLPTRPSLAEGPQAGLQLNVIDISVAQVSAQQWESVHEIPAQVRAQVNFQLSGTAADEATADKLPYAVQVLACELVSGQTLLLGEARGQLRPDVLEYSSTIEFTFPSVGRYQIMGVILLPGNNKAEAGLGPVLRSVSGR